MRNIIINSYINKITKEDIKAFATKENILINDKEINLIYNAIKKDKNIILSKEFYTYIKQYENKLSKEVYNKIIELAKKYESFIL